MTPRAVLSAAGFAPLARADGAGQAAVTPISTVPSKDDLVIKRGTTRKLGPTMPSTLLAADEVIG